MKKLFENWRRHLNEAEDEPTATWTNNADIARKHREARKAAAAARAAEKYGPKADGAGTKGPSAEKPPFQKSGKMARRHRSRGGKGVGSFHPKERETEDEGENPPQFQNDGEQDAPSAFDEWLGDLNITRPQYNRLYAKRTVDQPADLIGISFNKDGSIDAEWEDRRGRIEVTTLEARSQPDDERSE